MKVTREQILAIMPNAKDKVDDFLPYINGYADVYHIDTPIRMAHFLAQIAHESGELRYTKELQLITEQITDTDIRRVIGYLLRKLTTLTWFIILASSSLTFASKLPNLVLK
jgi:predicted chitinase